MQSYCLETTFIVDFLRGEKAALEKYDSIKALWLMTTSVVAWEILRGPKLCGRAKEYDAALRFLEQLDILPFTLTAARIAAEIERDLEEKGQKINLVDVLIAATSLEANAHLVTRDENYRAIPGLNVTLY